MLTGEERRILQNLVDFGGTGPDTPVLRCPEAVPMMRRGLIEVIKPPAPYLSYARITPAGLAALEESDD